jgi:uncharacterized protein
VEIELSRLAAIELPVCGELRLDDGASSGQGRSLASQGIRFPRPFRIDAVARRLETEILVMGRIEGEVQFECGRCLEPFAHAIGLDFAARYAPQPDPASAGAEGGESEDEIEIDAEDLDVSVIPEGATSLSVEEMVREQVLLALPVRALCREDCRGLCAHCGVNLNEDECSCSDEQPRDLRLAPLLELKRKLKDE